jgi:hypothetical protein
MGDVLRWLARLDGGDTAEEIAGVLACCDADGADVALDVLLGLQDRDARYRSSVIATLETALDAWLEPSVARATATVAASRKRGCSTAATRCTSRCRPTTSTASAVSSPP